MSCSKQNQENQNASQDAPKLSTILDNYYEERLPLFPLEATAIADHRFDDQLPNDLSQEHRNQVKNLYTKYLNQLGAVDTASLDQQEKLSYAIFKRDMEMALEAFQFNEHLMPVHQFWGLPITMAQLGSGASNHPFKTVKTTTTSWAAWQVLQFGPIPPWPICAAEWPLGMYYPKP